MLESGIYLAPSQFEATMISLALTDDDIARAAAAARGVLRRLRGEGAVRNVDKKDVPAVTVPRLALYLRKLRELRARGVERVSCKDLAEMIDLNAAQIRKDFSYFGEFGTRGVGYEVARLVDEITHCLGLDHSWNVIIVGAGLLGTALARYRGFSRAGLPPRGACSTARRR